MCLDTLSKHNVNLGQHLKILVGHMTDPGQMSPFLHLSGRDTVLTEIRCFHDYGKEFALSLLYYLKIRKSDELKEI